MCIQVCIIGAGKMSRLLVKHMASKGLNKLTILNRSLPRVEALKEEFPEVEFDVHLMPDLMQCIQDCDTIFAASGSEDILVHKEDLAGEFCVYFWTHIVFVALLGCDLAPLLQLCDAWVR